MVKVAVIIANRATSLHMSRGTQPTGQHQQHDDPRRADAARYKSVWRVVVRVDIHGTCSDGNEAEKPTGEQEKIF